MEYGFVPKAIINSMKDKDWKIRLDGVEKVCSSIPPRFLKLIHYYISSFLNW